MKKSIEEWTIAIESIEILLMDLSRVSEESDERED